jgi:2-oxo-4-hydroxy-4-carboxy-5-ureidoimidazoline decarboxylase
MSTASMTREPRATLDLRQLATLDRPAFTAALGTIFEHTPWVAEAAWALRPFDSLDALHAAMMGALRAAPPGEQLAFLRRHPELAGREAQAGTMTDHSTREQAGLNALSHEQLDELRRLNAAYAQRHGFPFMIAVLGHTRAQIFEALRTRVGNPTATEFEAALQQVAAITRRRLDTLFACA